jgi:hypothetical protein
MEKLRKLLLRLLVWGVQKLEEKPVFVGGRDSVFDWEHQKPVSFIDLVSYEGRAVCTGIRRFNFETQSFEFFLLKLNCLPVRVQGMDYTIPDTAGMVGFARRVERFDSRGVIHVLTEVGKKIDRRIQELQLKEKIYERYVRLREENESRRVIPLRLRKKTARAR